RIGPDYFSLDLGDGRSLMLHTFANTPDDPRPGWGFNPDGRLQTYPAPIPAEPVARWTGAASINELGYITTGGGYSYPTDSVYAIDLTIPHSVSDLTINFAASEL